MGSGGFDVEAEPATNTAEQLLLFSGLVTGHGNQRQLPILAVLLPLAGLQALQGSRAVGGLILVEEVAGGHGQLCDHFIQWRREAGADDAALVRRALDWIRAEFAYTLETPLPGRNAVDEFLFDTLRGFCAHYAGAMTFVLRAAGIPARVVTGFAGGTRNPVGDYWVLRRMDAHAWAEVWLGNAGWQRVDPTAAVAPARL